MKILVQRVTESPYSITGELSVDGQLECFTLEPARTNPVNAGHPCITTGTFKVILTPSPHLGYITPELVDVPQREDIRIHIGNAPINTLGCILVGTSLGPQPDFIGQSKEAFASLMTLIKAALYPTEGPPEDIWITVADPVSQT